MSKRVEGMPNWNIPRKYVILGRRKIVFLFLTEALVRFEVWSICSKSKEITIKCIDPMKRFTNLEFEVWFS